MEEKEKVEVKKTEEVKESTTEATKVPEVTKEVVENETPKETNPSVDEKATVISPAKKIEEPKEESVLPEKKEQDIKIIEESKEEQPKKEEVPVEEKESAVDEKKEEIPQEEKTSEEPKEETKKEETPVEEKESAIDEKKEENPKEEKPSEDPKEEKVEGQKTEGADFTSMFGVASEEAEDGTPLPKDFKKEEPEEEPSSDLPKFEIPEEKEEVKIKGNELDKADFSTMFGVASEEQPEKPVEVKEEPKQEEVPVVTTPTIETPVEEPKEETPVPVVSKETIDSHKTSNYNAEEKTLYTIKEEKEGNPIMVLLFFVALIVFLIFLPTITNTSESALERLYGQRVNNTQTEPEEEVVKSKYYYIGQTSSIDIDDLRISNVVKQTRGSEYLITMTIVNQGNRVYQYDKNYFIVMYDENQVVFNIKLFSYDAIPPAGSTEITFVINEKAYNQANRFQIELKEKSEYPDVTLQMEEDGYKVLTCIYFNDEMKYYFRDDKLVKIRETYSEEKTTNNLSYDNHKEIYKALSEKYKAIDGFEPIFVDRNATDADVTQTFEMINNLDLSVINDKTLSNLATSKFFKYNESKNTVSYEALALGYTCSS